LNVKTPGIVKLAAVSATVALFFEASAGAQEEIPTTSDTVTRTVPKAPPPLFRVLAHAQSRCPFDVPVWLDPRSRAYLLPGQPGYAVGLNAAYACKREADAFGDRPARK